jgi:short-subunit dehydrogenase involved in D-alanine esterification of teichoic acids
MEGVVMKTNGNVVLITGGSSGIGLAMAERFAENNNEVIIVGRSEDKLLTAKKKLPGKVSIEVADIMNTEDLHRLAKRFKDINILVNNAGMRYHYNMNDPEIPEDYINNEIQTNLVAPIILTKVFLPLLMSKENAAVINVTSSLGIVPKATAAVYCGNLPSK